MPRRRFTMVETALIACLAGIVLAVFLPTFVRELRTNKISEASELLAELAARVQAYYRNSQHRCLPPGAGPTPAEASTDRRPVRFFEEPGGSVWRALRFEPEEPIRYRYTFLPSREGCELPVGTSATLRADGDLDGDGRHSAFERTLRVNHRFELIHVGILEIRDRVE